LVKERKFQIDQFEDLFYGRLISMNKVGIILSVLLLLVTINSTYFFLGVSKVSFLEWLVFNACAPSNIAYLIGFVIFMFTKDRTALHVAIIPLFFFGGLGLFLFPWSGFNLIAQVSHIIMVLNMFWTLCGTFRTSDFKAAALGLLIGVVLFLPFINYQQMYAYTHPAAFQKILGVSSDDFQKKFNMKRTQ
jgi:hypothetical protein